MSERNCYTCGKEEPTMVSVPLQEDGPRRVLVCSECDLKIRNGEIEYGADAGELRTMRVARRGEELLRRQREDLMDLAVRNAAMSGNWKMLRDVILDQGERLIKLERFAADLIAELEAKN